jgi:hypothetical protein
VGFHATLGLPDEGLLDSSPDSCLISGDKAQNYKIKRPVNTYKNVPVAITFSETRHTILCINPLKVNIYFSFIMTEKL